jgi:hypothetical protein
MYQFETSACMASWTTSLYITCGTAFCRRYELYVGKKSARRPIFVTKSIIAGESFGIWHTEFVHHGPLKINGERLLLRGTHRHEGHAARCLTGQSTEDALIKDMADWMTPLCPGKNTLRVIANKGAATVTGEIGLLYQLEKWYVPTELKLIREESHSNRR